MTSTATHLLCGVDENGLGPRLGPLVVTAAWARATPDGARAVDRRGRRPLARLGDSKALVRFGDVALGEAWARVLLAREGARTGAPAPRSPREALARLGIDGEATLAARCPDAHRGQCWSEDGERFEADEALLAKVGRDVARLAARGVDLAGARLAVVCTERLNEAAARGVSRFAVDLLAMERLALAVSALEADELAFTCGKVGGYDRYADRFGPLVARAGAPASVATLEEGRARSAYRVPGVGTLAFVRDADATHTLVSLASLVGKWAREVLMARIVRWHQAIDPNVPRASGYHDPTTARFVRATALARRKRALPDDCFERTRAVTEDEGKARTPRATLTSRA